ncbi:MAG: NlpC/P60 family protein [Desulfococcaceae bacterium]|jgi:cell wall-associated NlpC family hydrolase|nr:NlpC/P60 family protein [Desulfococcaceae bacterium]
METFSKPLLHLSVPEKTPSAESQKMSSGYLPDILPAASAEKNTDVKTENSEPGKISETSPPVSPETSENTAGKSEKTADADMRAAADRESRNAEAEDKAEKQEIFYENLSRIPGIGLDGTEDRELMMMIDEWIGTPYRMGGCSKSGIDCSCLVKTIFEDVYGISLSRTSRSIFKESERISKEELQEGDIICFRNRSKRISHIGIYLKDGKFVHASQKYGVTVSDMNKRYFKKRYAGAGRILSGSAVRLSKILPPVLSESE